MVGSMPIKYPMVVKMWFTSLYVQVDYIIFRLIKGKVVKLLDIPVTVGVC